MFTREFGDVIEIDQAVFVRVIGDAFPKLRGRGGFPAVGEVSAGGQIQTHEDVARLAGGEIDGEVGRAAGVRLDVDVRHAEQPFGAIARQIFDLVHDLVAGVITFARIAFGVFVHEHGGHGFEHGRGAMVFGRDERELFGLALKFFLGELGHGGVGLQEMLHRGKNKMM